MHERKVTVVESGNGPYGQFITSGRHVLGADELGRNWRSRIRVLIPSSCCLLPLGACTAMTIRMYANRKGLRLDRISVQLRHAQRASGSDIKDRFERVITLDGQLSTEERQHLLAIAERCPVSQTLKRSSDITSLVAEEMPERAALSAA